MSAPVTDVAMLDRLPREQQELAVTMMLDQGKQWLARALEATNPAREVADFKAFVATVAEAAKQKKLSEDIQLDAVEMVRRSERALGQAIRKGQDAGEIGAEHRTGGPRDDYERHGQVVHVDRVHDADPISPSAYVGGVQSSLTSVYAMTDDVSDSTFEDAIADARAEGNLSRANVVRKIKNLPTYSEQQTAKWHQIRDLAAQRLTSAQIARQVGMTEQGLRSGARREGITFPADDVIGKSRRVDGADVLERIITSLEVNESVVGLVDFSHVTPDEARDMLDRLSVAMRPINHIRKQLKEISHDYAE